MNNQGIKKECQAWGISHDSLDTLKPYVPRLHPLGPVDSCESRCHWSVPRLQTLCRCLSNALSQMVCYHNPGAANIQTRNRT